MEDTPWVWSSAYDQLGTPVGAQLTFAWWTRLQLRLPSLLGFMTNESRDMAMATVADNKAT